MDHCGYIGPRPAALGILALDEKRSPQPPPVPPPRDLEQAKNPREPTRWLLPYSKFKIPVSYLRNNKFQGCRKLAGI